MTLISWPLRLCFQVLEFEACFASPGLELESSLGSSQLCTSDLGSQGRNRGYRLCVCERRPVGKSIGRKGKDRKTNSVNKNSPKEAVSEEMGTVRCQCCGDAGLRQA